MPNLVAAILDMDGLLCDSEPFWREVEVRELNRLGVPLTEEMCLQTVGLRVEEAVSYWRERYPWEGCSIAELSATLTAAVRSCIRERGTLMPGVRDAVSLLRTRGLRLAVASGSRRVLIDEVLDTLNLREGVEVIVSAEEVEHGKPHPEIFLTTARRMGVDAQQCLVFEDSINGVIAAKAARMRCIAVPGEPWRDDTRFALADSKLESLHKLTPELLDSLGAA